ncbi:MAG: PAC2 family protein [Armatimonadetes bacterium]|nr:PAC2 family protein [Armatimonadota bacterium]
MEELEIRHRPNVIGPAMVMGFSGWMDGGSVSTGTVGYLVDRLNAQPFAAIRPHDFYILNFPISTIPLSIYTSEGKAVLTSANPMDIAAVFRPSTRIEDGVIRELTFPKNEFYCSESANLILFVGEEPHIRWGAYTRCLFEVAEAFGVRELYFIGSVAGPLPHTREPRLRASVADDRLKAKLADLAVGYSEYEGPASITTALSFESPAHGIAMRTLVVDVPHYPFVEMPAYPRSILKTTAALNDLLDLGLDLDDLRRSSATVEERLNALLEDNDTFRELVVKLQAIYDREAADPDEELLKRLMDGIDLGDSRDE